MTPLAAQVAKVDMLRNNLNDRCGKEDIKMAEKTDMQKDVDWYYANLDSLLPTYNGRYLAIADGRLFGAFDECLDGVRAMESAGRKRGTYIVHKCIPLEQERREWYYRSNRVRFGACPK